MSGRCDKWRPMTSNASSPSHTHEEIASMCLRSHAFGGEVGYTEAEREWANGEVGEGVEETWERAVSSGSSGVRKSMLAEMCYQWETSGRYISTLSPECLRKTGQQETGVSSVRGDHAVSCICADFEQVPLFFSALHRLYNQFPTAKLLASGDVGPQPCHGWHRKLIHSPDHSISRHDVYSGRDTVCSLCGRSPGCSERAFNVADAER